MSESKPEPENSIKSIITVEHQILKEYSQSYYWGTEIKSVIGRVVPGIIKFFSKNEITSTNSQLSTSSCIRVFWRIKEEISGHNGQKIDLLILGDYIEEFKFQKETILLKSVDFFINKAGDIVSDIKLTFFDMQRATKENKDIYRFLEVAPMYITPQKLTKMSNLYNLITDLIEKALKENQ